MLLLLLLLLMMMMMMMMLMLFAVMRMQLCDPPAGGPHERCMASFTCSSQLELVDTTPISA